MEIPTIRVDGESVPLLDDSLVEGVQDVSLEYDANSNGYDVQVNCKSCGEGVFLNDRTWLHQDSGSVYCGEDDAPQEYEYDSKEEYHDAVSQWRSEVQSAEPDLEHPSNWCNNAAIRIHEDRITVTISVGDPRGAFAMSIHRGEDGDLRLSVPDPSDSLPHMKLTQLSPGFFRVGGE